jgi:hypothetical protein
VSTSRHRIGSPLFDHLIGAQPDRWRHRKAERLSGLEVQDHPFSARFQTMVLLRQGDMKNGTNYSNGL